MWRVNLCLLIKLREVFTRCDNMSSQNYGCINFHADLEHMHSITHTFRFHPSAFSCVSPSFRNQTNKRSETNQQIWYSISLRSDRPLAEWKTQHSRHCMCSDLTCDSFWRLWQPTSTVVLCCSFFLKNNEKQDYWNCDQLLKPTRKKRLLYSWWDTELEHLFSVASLND